MTRGQDGTRLPDQHLRYSAELAQRRVSSGGRQYFHLDGAMEFCQKIAAGEIKLKDLQAAYDAEDAVKERAAALHAARNTGNIVNLGIITPFEKYFVSHYR